MKRLGVVKQAGSAVELVKAGERVVIPTHLYCGVCVNCARGYSAACLRVRPGSFGTAYGYAGMGPYRGAQAELLRVPFADANCIPVPGNPSDDREDDFVLLADAFVTGWHATELAAVRAGCTVAVFGAGAIGLLAAYSALLKGAAEVYVVDGVPERLDKADTNRSEVSTEKAGLARRLGTADAVVIGLSAMIGAGVFAAFAPAAAAAGTGLLIGLLQRGTGRPTGEIETYGQSSRAVRWRCSVPVTR
jgi:threonine dehydrogenase-like Zn-dependent dehydrogenase